MKKLSLLFVVTILVTSPLFSWVIVEGNVRIWCPTLPGPNQPFGYYPEIEANITIKGYDSATGGSFVRDWSAQTTGGSYEKYIPTNELQGVARLEISHANPIVYLLSKHDPKVVSTTSLNNTSHTVNFHCGDAHPPIINGF